MHLDHSRFVEILADAAGVEKEKAEKQLEELVTEIHQAIEEGEAYEVEGFGIFSGIGNKTIFIPSDELATEINYKYVGMEAIELSDSSAAEEKEDKVVAETSDEDEDFEDDPFAGLLDDEDEEQDYVDTEDEEESPFGAEPVSEETTEDIFSLSDSQEEEDSDSEESEEEKPGPDKWGIDSYKDEGAENMFAGLLDENEGWNDETESSAEEEETSEDSSKQLNDSEKGSGEEEDEDDEERLRILLDTEADTDEEEGSDNPFEGLIEEEKESGGKEKKEEVVPVITNISSDIGEKKPQEKKREATRKRTAAKKRQSSPAMLYVLLAIILIGGSIFALGYFNVVDIPGLSSQTTATQVAGGSPVADDTSEDETLPVEEGQEEAQEDFDDNQNAAEETAGNEEEQSPEAAVSEVDAEPAPDQPLYGLRGTPVSEANSGYTIVLFSLSRENNAINQQQQLSDMGYRVLVNEIQSSQYGRMWRVSIGQFESLRDAAIASEGLEEPYSENYFITKIQ